MRKEKVNVWGRDFILNIIYDVYSGEEVLTTQIDALDNFLDDESITDSALEPVKKYCLKNENMINVECIDNIFKYVIPTTIFVERSEKERLIQLICNYKWDMEHGLMLNFKNECFVGID